MTFSLQFFLFFIVGAVGFVVDASTLYLLKDHFGLYQARGFSFFAAVATTWLLNRSITFSKNKSGRSKKSEFAIYFLLMAIGGTVNYAIYAIIINVYQLAHDHPIIAVAAGSAVGMLVNITTSKLLLFRHTTE